MEPEVIEETNEEAVEESTDQPEATEDATEAESTDQPAEAQEELFETPDGRKVNAETLAKEWKDNFMPEFTRKSQRLSELEGTTKKTDATQEKTKQPWEDPNWVPTSIQEVLEAAEQRIEAKQTARQEAERQREQQITQMVEGQLADIRKEEPDLNEDLLFSHATKYGFNDLKNAYRNMKDTNMAVKRTEQKVVANMKARGGMPEASPKGGATDDGLTYGQFVEDLSESPLEALRRMNGK